MPAGEVCLECKYHDSQTVMRRQIQNLYSVDSGSISGITITNT